MQRRCHVDAGVIIVEALEAHILRIEVGSDSLEKRAEPHAAPFANRTPAFNANVARNLRGLGKRVELWQGPSLLVTDQPRELQDIAVGVYCGNFILRVESVERKRLGDGACGIFRREPVRIEEPGLNAVIPARHRRQRGLHALVFRELAPREQCERPQAQPLLEEQPSLEHAYLRRSLVFQAVAHAASFHHLLRMRPVIMLGKVRGTRITMSTCTRAMNTTAHMAKKCTRRAPS